MVMQALRRQNSDYRVRRCGTKRVYHSWREAETEALRLIEDLRDGKLRMQKGYNIFAYRCSVCDRWHIGHQWPPHIPFKEPWSHRTRRRKPMTQEQP